MSRKDLVFRQCLKLLNVRHEKIEFLDNDEKCKCSSRKDQDRTKQIL